MKYRSYNSELLIATTLMCDVFNDVIIDRRKHGLKKDYSKGIRLEDIVQQTIEVPCILGNRGIILKSLENEPGKYKLPLIIVQSKDIKTDTIRMCDLHADVFYQQDNHFSSLDEEDSKYHQTILSKRRGQPITISYDVTFITKYKEDLDQIISNFAVHFRPDIYLRWWHPQIKKEPLSSQLLWSQQISVDSNVDYNPQNIHIYKATTSFTFKSWLFFGLEGIENRIDPALDPIIKYFKFFPNIDNNENNEDSNDFYAFGNPIKNVGTLGFHGVSNDQNFYSKNPDDPNIMSGDYAVNNIFSENYSLISGDSLFQNIKYQTGNNDYLSNHEENGIQTYQDHQNYIMFDSFENGMTEKKCYIKNVHFKSRFKQSDLYKNPPSGDLLFQKFFTEYQDKNKISKSLFGESFIDYYQFDIDYNVNSKDLVLYGENNFNNYSFYSKAKFNSVSGHFIEIELKSNNIKSKNDFISYSFHKEYDIKLNELPEKFIENKRNIKTMEDVFPGLKTYMYIDNFEFKLALIHIYNFVKKYWNSINLNESNKNQYTIEFDDDQAEEELSNSKDLTNYGWRNLFLSKLIFNNNFYYHVLTNRYIYIVLKVDKNNSICDVYDFGITFPVTYKHNNALIYEITIPESSELLGLNFYLGL